MLPSKLNAAKLDIEDPRMKVMQVEVPMSFIAKQTMKLDKRETHL